MTFSEVDSSNLEQYATGKQVRRKARGKYPDAEYVKVGSRKDKTRKKAALPRKSVVKA